MAESWDRILIVGCSGAGKSTLARHLSERLDLPVTHLDRLYWQKGWVEDNPTFDAQVVAATEQPRWVIDGGYTGRPSFRNRLDRADVILLLDFPRWLCLLRVARRTIRHYGRDRPDMGAGCPERFDRDFLAYIWNWRRASLPPLLERLVHFRGPVLRLTSPGAVQDVLRRSGNKSISPETVHG